MGLDTVELVMAFERAFNIEISDDAAQSSVTVRDAIDYIYSQVEHSDASACCTQRAFHRLRLTAQDVLGVERSSIRPATPLETLIPIEQRQKLWSRLSQAVGSDEWPSLHRSAEVSRLIVTFVIGSAATAFVVAPEYNLMAALVAAVAATWLSLRATAHWRLHFAENEKTVGQLTEHLAIDLPRAWRPSKPGWTRNDVRTVVRRITCEHLNIDQRFSDEAAFIDDLGAD